MSKLLFELRAVIEHPVIKIVDHLAPTHRGTNGFGSTGN